MRIDYIGVRNLLDGDGKHRSAVISYNYDNKRERYIIDRLAFYLERIKGWSLSVDECYAEVEVEDRKEYDEFVKDYRAFKKVICDSLKYGFVKIS